MPVHHLLRCTVRHGILRSCPVSSLILDWLSINRRNPFSVFLELCPFVSSGAEMAGEERGRARLGRALQVRGEMMDYIRQAPPNPTKEVAFLSYLPWHQFVYREELF